jgi:hypothetical protein
MRATLRGSCLIESLRVSGLRSRCQINFIAVTCPPWHECSEIAKFYRVCWQSETWYTVLKPCACAYGEGNIIDADRWILWMHPQLQVSKQSAATRSPREFTYYVHFLCDIWVILGWYYYHIRRRLGRVSWEVDMIATLLNLSKLLVLPLFYIVNLLTFVLHCKPSHLCSTL